MVFFLAIFLVLHCAEITADRSPIIRYHAGHSYSYNFNGQIASSLSNGDYYSTIRIRSEISIEFENDNTALIKLVRPELGKLTDYLESSNFIQPFDKFEVLDIKREHEGQLILPFEIQYNNGRISEIKFDREDSTWSENIKRSVINLLQIELENSLESARLYPNSYFYQVNETTIEGECETTYHIQKMKDLNDFSNDEPLKPTVNITKTVNFDKCLQRPEIRYNFYRHSEPVDWKSQTKNHEDSENQQTGVIDPVVNSISHYEYNVHDQIIKKAYVMSKYSYDLVDKDHVSLTTITTGLLEFIAVKLRHSYDNNFSKKIAQSLIYSNELELLRERFITQGNEDYLQQNPYLKVDNAVELIKNIFRRLIKGSIERKGPEGIEEDATCQFSRLVTTLRQCSLNNIQQINEKLFNNGNNETTQIFIKEILADALAVSGTKNTIDYLVKLIESEEITVSKALRTLENLYKLRQTSEQMVRPIWKLCESEISRKNEKLKRSCYLAYGAMVNAMCGHSHEHKQDHEKWAISSTKEKICSIIVKQKFVDDIMHFYQQSSHKSDKILALKTLGNMGIDLSIDQLEKIIIEKSEDRFVRITAIDALRNLRDQVSQKIQRLLTPIFRDLQEHPEIRINAFHTILLTHPNFALMHLLCTEMVHEPNADVKSFVVSSIQQLAKNADNTLDKETSSMAKSCIILLEQMGTVFARQAFSKKYQAGYFSNPTNRYGLGSLLNFASTFSNDSYIPEELMTSLDLLINGRFNPNIWQFGVHMQELEQFANRMSHNFKNKSFDDIVIRGRRSFPFEHSPFEMLKNFFRKMQIVGRNRNVNAAEPMLLFYNRHNNLDYSFYIIDESNLPRIVKKLHEGHLDVNLLKENYEIIRNNGGIYNFESQIKLPTTIGIHMIISSRMTTVGFVNGKYSLTFGNSKKVRSANFSLEVHPQIASTVVVKTEIFSPLFTSGVKTVHSIQVRLPIKMSAEIKSPNLIPTISWILPEKELRIVHFQSRPVIFTRVWPQKSNVFIEATEKTLIIPELNHLYTTNDFELISPFTENKFSIKSHYYRKPFSDYDWILSGENAFELRLKPTQRSAKHIRLSGQTSLFRNSQSQQKLEEIFILQPALIQTDEEIQSLQQFIRTISSKSMDLHEFYLKLETLDLKQSITMDIKTIYDERMSVCIFDKEIKVDYGHNVWAWKTLGQIAFPKLYGIYAPIKSSHVIGKIESNWGSKDKNTVIFNIYGSPSEMMVKQLKKNLNKVAEVSNIDRPQMLDSKFTKLMSNKYIVAIEYQITDDTVSTIVPIYNWMKTCPRVNVYTSTSKKLDQHIPLRHSALIAHVTYDNFLNLTLSTFEKQMEFLNTSGKQMYKQNTIFSKFANKYNDYPKCDYELEQIKTFDEQFIKIPLTTCYTFLAKDCGDSNDPRFTIMAKKLTKNEYDLSIKFITQKNTFELYKEQNNGEMVIKIDNQIQTSSEYDHYNIRKIESSEMIFYEIKSNEAQVILRFDGQKISIKMISNDYVNRQCGLCGLKSKNNDDDYFTRDNVQAKSINEFHLSYINRDAGKCDRPAIQQLEKEIEINRRQNESKSIDQHVQNNSESENRDKNTRDPIKKTIIAETRDQICFSLKPVKSCQKGYHYDDEGIQKENVEFKCFKRSSYVAQIYVFQAREMDLEFKNYRADMNEKVAVPRRCIKY